MRAKTLLLLIGILLLIGLPSYFLPRKIVINSIKCDNQFGRCRETVLERIEEYQGKNLNQVRKGIEEFLETEPLISDYSTHYKIPDELEINVILRKPHFGITFDTSDTIALVDEEGYVLAFKDETSLPTLDSNEPPPQVGDRVSNEVLFSLSLLGDMYEYYQVKDAVKEEDSLTFDMGDGKRAIFPTEGDGQILVASLSVILTRLNAEGAETRIENVEGLKTACQGGCTIDLRYKNPVVR